MADSTETDAWQAYSLALMLRDCLRLHGGEGSTGVVLEADVADAVLVAAHRLVELTRTLATAEV